MRANEFTEPTAAGIILYAEDTGRYGLQQRSDDINDPGMWAAWGGGREPGESLEQCARRELGEESGYTGPIKLHHLADNSKYTTFIGVVPHEFEPRANDEWKDYCWVEAGDWPGPMHPGVAAALENIAVNEAFDQPYKTKSEKSEYGDVDMLARLPDGTNLSIMFNKQQDDDGEEITQVEFYRNNSQEVTGEGDAQRIFATVLTSIQKYIKKYKPSRLSFSASKATDPTIYYEPGQPQPNPESRAKLYDRLVQRYARAWGYRAFRADTGDLVIYELSRLQPAMSENFADGKVKGKSRPGRVKRAGASCDGSVTDLRQRAKNASGERARMYHWCANMKSGREKTNEDSDMKTYRARVRLPDQHNTVVVDAQVTARNYDAALRMFKAQWGPDSLVSTVTEVK
jgi:8-oxo-dGTP pyrophosphatase MutT (NUDIX family)